MKYLLLSALLFASGTIASEPKGLKLSNDSVIEWGVNCHEFAARMGQVDEFASKYGMDLKERCRPDFGYVISKGMMLISPPFAGGGVARFAEQGGFGEYTLIISPEHFAGIEEAISNAVGKPKIREETEIQNRMGAKFGDVTTIWETENVIINARKRALTVDEGTFTVTYKPLKNSLQNEKKKVNTPF